MFYIDPYRKNPLKIFLSETRSLICGTQLCLVDFYKDCSNYSPGVKTGPAIEVTCYTKSLIGKNL